MSDATVSVIIPTFNRAHLLQASVGSAACDSSVAEVIVIDDGSTDQTADVVATLSRKIPHLRYVRQNNAGPSGARNRGLEEAKCLFVRFLDSDDVLVPRYSSRQALMLAANPQHELCYGIVNAFGDGVSHSGYAVGSYQNPTEDLLGGFLSKFPFPVCSAVYSKALCLRLGGFDLSLSHYEDWEFNARAVTSATGVLRTLDTVARVRTHGGDRLSTCATKAQSYHRFLKSVRPLFVNSKRPRHQLMWLASVARCYSWAIREGCYDIAEQSVALVAQEYPRTAILHSLLGTRSGQTLVALYDSVKRYV